MPVNDDLIGVAISNGDQDIILATVMGQAIRFPEDTVRSMGRTARGVRGIKLRKGDEVCSLVVVREKSDDDKPPTVLTVCEYGCGKRTTVKDYRITNRGGKGIINIRTSKRNGNVVAVKAVHEDDQLIMVTAHNKLMRTDVGNISVMGRATQGVKLISLDSKDGDYVAAVARVDSELGEIESEGDDGDEGDDSEE